MYRSSVRFDTVVVVESLPAGEPQTGTDLFNTSIRTHTSSLGTKLFSVSDRSEFFAALSATEAIANEGHGPILHLEAHGNEGGIQLASKELVDWTELIPHLTAINVACRMNLLVIAAACKGWHLASILRPTDRAPIWASIGPVDDIYSDRLLRALKQFYDALLATLDLNSALANLNDNSEMEHWAFRIQQADLLYCVVFANYIKANDTPAARGQRVEQLVSAIKHQHGLVEHDRPHIRAGVENLMSDHELWFNKYRDHFLMLDLFPDSRGRFPRVFQDCLAGAPSGG